MQSQGVSPTTTYVGECDQIWIPVIVLPIVWNQGEYVRGKLVDKCKGVLRGFEKAEEPAGEKG